MRFVFVQTSRFGDNVAGLHLFMDLRARSFSALVRRSNHKTTLLVFGKIVLLDGSTDLEVIGVDLSIYSIEFCRYSKFMVVSAIFGWRGAIPHWRLDG